MTPTTIFQRLEQLPLELQAKIFACEADPRHFLPWQMGFRRGLELDKRFPKMHEAVDRQVLGRVRGLAKRAREIEDPTKQTEKIKLLWEAFSLACTRKNLITESDPHSDEVLSNEAFRIALEISDLQKNPAALEEIAGIISCQHEYLAHMYKILEYLPNEARNQLLSEMAENTVLNLEEAFELINRRTSDEQDQRTARTYAIIGHLHRIKSPQNLNKRGALSPQEFILIKNAINNHTVNQEAADGFFPFLKNVIKEKIEERNLPLAREIVDNAPRRLQPHLRSHYFRIRFPGSLRLPIILQSLLSYVFYHLEASFLSPPQNHSQSDER